MKRARRTTKPRRAAEPRAPKFARAVYALVREVPRGKVVTYGQVAAILGHPRAARAVGTALSNLTRPMARVVPWQRVINAAGRISIRGDIMRPDLQRQLLELEGVVFRGDHVDLKRFRWAGPKRERRVHTKVEL
jgi:methylated-DNA-protein-cysteine methyltransferase related protein